MYTDTGRRQTQQKSTTQKTINMGITNPTKNWDELVTYSRHNIAEKLFIWR